MACVIVCYLVRNRKRKTIFLMTWLDYLQAWMNVKQLETHGKTDEIACANTNFGQSHQFPHQASFGRYLPVERLTKTVWLGRYKPYLDIGLVKSRATHVKLCHNKYSLGCVVEAGGYSPISLTLPVDLTR